MRSDAALARKIHIHRSRGSPPGIMLHGGVYGHMNVSAYSGILLDHVGARGSHSSYYMTPNDERLESVPPGCSLAASLQACSRLEEHSPTHERNSTKRSDIMQADRGQSHIRPCDNMYICMLDYERSLPSPGVAPSISTHQYCQTHASSQSAS